MTTFAEYPLSGAVRVVARPLPAAQRIVRVAKARASIALYATLATRALNSPSFSAGARRAVENRYAREMARRTAG